MKDSEMYEHINEMVEARGHSNVRPGSKGFLRAILNRITRLENIVYFKQEDPAKFILR